MEWRGKLLKTIERSCGTMPAVGLGMGEKMKNKQIGPYSEYDTAQSRAIRLQEFENAKSVRIDKSTDGWWINYVQDEGNA